MKINNDPRSFVKNCFLISPALPLTPTLYRITLFNIPISTTKIIPNTRRHNTDEQFTDRCVHIDGCRNLVAHEILCEPFMLSNRIFWRLNVTVE